MSPFALITARAGSSRLPRKNMFPIGGIKLVHRSIEHAREAGLQIVLSTDIQELIKYEKSKDIIVVERPVNMRDGNRHIDSMRHAIRSAVSQNTSLIGSPVVLLQPTSPFRLGNIIKKSIERHAENPHKNLFTGRVVNAAKANGEKFSEFLWDGCVAIYNQERLMFSESNQITKEDIFQENEYANTIQIDTEDDYIQACILSWRMDGANIPIDDNSIDECKKILCGIVSNKKVTLVGRPDKLPINQSELVAYVNHCKGYEGGRADILFVVAGRNIVTQGINKELEEVAMKSDVVIIRDFGKASWVLENLKTKTKPYVVKTPAIPITTGCFSSCILHACGGIVERVGFQSGAERIAYCEAQFYSIEKVSDEIALLHVTGKDRRYVK